MKNVKNITVNFVPSKKFPVYCKYPLARKPQPAYITLDLETGEVSAQYQIQYNATPEAIFNKRVVTLPLPPRATKAQILEKINANIAFLEKVLNQSEIVNRCGRRVGLIPEPLEREIQRRHLSFQGFDDFEINEMLAP